MRCTLSCQPSQVWRVAAVRSGGEGAAGGMQPAFPAGMQIALFDDQAQYIENAIAGVRNTLLEALVLVVLSVFVFLGNPRQVLIIALVIPITLAINVFVMRLAGFSLNIFSLGGMAIAIGIMLDTATIVIENITRLRRAQPSAPMAEVAWRATLEVGPAVTAATLAFVALFLPFLLVSGMITLLFRELVLIILSIIGIALAMALFLVPMLSSLLLARVHSEKTNFSERLNDAIARHSPARRVRGRDQRRRHRPPVPNRPAGGSAARRTRGADQRTSVAGLLQAGMTGRHRPGARRRAGADGQRHRQHPARLHRRRRADTLSTETICSTCACWCPSAR
ncbi:MAG: efflux RND transporter permease subunit [Lamprobacter sp.]|uniref:efflux RND transporter permease subunit n=1 Tax=Lamprobacter sp. TaxID=3100796 RepID=UPI002B263ACB|nr:efflux RND transporter permease subunit [Lamprobacter sp.]MEA3642035.1 efflux RND transporter permease subunit [Lamprobacter sp.]